MSLPNSSLFQDTSFGNNFDKVSKRKNLSNEGSDIILWQEFQSGSEDAYAIIYKNHVASLYQYGLKLANDKELIKDCIQDLFVELWNSKKNYGKVKSIRPYLFKAIRRKIISATVKKRKVFVETHNLDVIHKESASIERKLIEKQIFDQQQQKLKSVMEKLTDKQKEMIFLKFYAQLSYEEIAEIMSLSKKGAYKLLSRALKFLRKTYPDPHIPLLIVLILFPVEFFI